jgi:hypothetical protein
MNWAIEILPYIADAAGVGLVALLTAGFNWLRQKSKYEKVDRAISIAERLTKGVVTEMKQTLVDDLKAKGKFDKGTAIAVRAAAEARLKTQIKDELKTISKSMGDTGGSVLRSLIESAVYNSKQ